MANCIILTGGVFNHEIWSKAQRSVGPYRVATELEDAGYSTFVFDYVINFSLDEIKQVLKKHLGPDTIWIGFSSTFFHFPAKIKEKIKADLTKGRPRDGNGDPLNNNDMWWTIDGEVDELLQFIKDNSSAKIIYGGTKSEFFIGKNKFVDLYVLGLSDTVIVPLTEAIKNNDYSSLIHYEKFKNENDDSYCHYIDCKYYPEPAMDTVRTKFWLPQFNMLPGEATSIEFARGCIFKCKFCTYPLLGKKKGTYLRDAMQIRDDMLRIYDAYGCTNYYIADDTVNDDTDKLRALRDAFVTLPFKINLSGFFRLDLINRYPEQADIILDMGVNGVFFGIETFQPNSAKSIGKGLHPQKVLKALHWLHDDKWKGKVNIAAGIILGLPHDTLEYFEEFRELMMQPDFPIDNVQIYPLHLTNLVGDRRPGNYLSEFSLHPEIYGYEFPYINEGKESSRWVLPSQNLSYTLVNEIAKQFNLLRAPINKVGGFEMQKYVTIGISVEDLHKYTMNEIEQMYDIPDLNNKFFRKYKEKLGI